MHMKKLLPLALGAVTSAQNLTAAIASQNASLSTLSSTVPRPVTALRLLTTSLALLSTQPNLVSALGSASNITVLAPSNQAIAKFLNSTAGAAAGSNPGAVTALLTYHVLNGTYLASAFTNTSQFIPTLLTNTSYANVTGGQRVEAVSNGSSVVFTSGLLSTSTVTTPVRVMPTKLLQHS